MTTRMIVLRHGESQWNQENRFTGWVDVPLSVKGVDEAIRAGNILKKYLDSTQMRIHQTYTSYLRRAIHTHFKVLEVMEQEYLPVQRSWRLNERHYGALQGLNKEETALKYGDAQVKLWRRSYDTPPPALEPNSPMNPKLDPKYADLNPSELPLYESLKLTIDRVLPYWNQELKPRLLKGENLLIVAHGNSLRGLIKTIKNMSNEEILELNIPTAEPWSFEFETQLINNGQDLKLVKDGYLT